MNENEVDTKIQVLHFTLQNMYACIELQYINKVLPLVFLEAVPNFPVYFVGLMNLAGRSVPVIDLAMRLGMSRKTNYNLDTPILVCSDDKNTFGVIVDKVIELAEVDETKFQMRKEFTEPNSCFIAAVSFGMDFSLLINIKRIAEN